MEGSYQTLGDSDEDDGEGDYEGKDTTNTQDDTSSHENLDGTDSLTGTWAGVAKEKNFDFKVGKRVQIVDLHSHPLFNGKTGVIIKPAPPGHDGWTVSLDEGGHQHVHEKNLEVIK